MSAPCPICQKPVVTAFRPFCSRLCASRDLNQWLDGGYRIPTDEHADGDSPDGAATSDEAGTAEDGRDE